MHYSAQAWTPPFTLAITVTLSNIICDTSTNFISFVYESDRNNFFLKRNCSENDDSSGKKIFRGDAARCISPCLNVFLAMPRTQPVLSRGLLQKNRPWLVATRACSALSIATDPIIFFKK
jgi:hypothetical protein